MSSTNKTTNYDLSQFVGTDKPAWLADYNQDMSKIDSAIKSASDAGTGADGKADANATAIGTLANLTTDAKTSLVVAVNEVDSHADSAQNTASSALSTATSANNGVTAVENYLNMNNFTSYSSSSFTVTQGGGSLRSNSNITVARNAAGSLCKIYGFIVVDNSTGTCKVKLNSDTGLRPSEKITVTGTGFIENIPANYGLTFLNIDINTDGTIEFYGATSGTGVFRPIACVIFVKNFGDQPD